MYSSWQHLIIKNETELHDIARIRKLARASALRNWVAVFGFAIAGISSLGFMAFFISVGITESSLRFSMFPLALLMLGLAAILFWAAKMFRLEIEINPLRNFVKNPENFEIVKGTLESAGFVHGGGRANYHYVVVGKAISSSGAEVLAQEQFKARIWNFTTQEDDTALTKDDDWYEMKGKRPYLPVPAYFICQKNDPKFASLVGIDPEYIVTIKD